MCRNFGDAVDDSLTDAADTVYNLADTALSVSAEDGRNTVHDFRERPKEVRHKAAPEACDSCLHVLQSVLIGRRSLDCIIRHNAAELVHTVFHGLCIFGGGVQQGRHILRRPPKKLLRKRGALGAALHALQTFNNTPEEVFL